MNELPKKGDLISYTKLILKKEGNQKQRGMSIVTYVSTLTQPIITLQNGVVLFPTIGDFFNIEVPANEGVEK